jgi:hypothetical protein
VNGNVKTIASFVWACLYLLYVKKTAYAGREGVGAIVAFVQESTAGYQHVRVADLNRSFLDGGFALNAILDHHCPNVIDYDTLQPHLTQRNLERCFSKSKDELGVPLLLDATDFLEATSFDETSLVIYLSVYIHCVEKKKQ